MLDFVIDFFDEVVSVVKVVCEICLEVIDEFECKKFGLEVEIYVFEWEKDEVFKERLEVVKKVIVDLEDKLGFLKWEYENDKYLGD